MSKTEIVVALIGIGPHAKRIYMPFLHLLGVKIGLVVELKSKQEEVMNCFCEREDCDFCFISDFRKDQQHLSQTTFNKLSRIIKKRKISHAIIATEPKAHFAYCELFLKNKIPILMDKPITAPFNVCHDVEMARQILKDAEHLNKLAKTFNTSLVINCQRRFHPSYLYIFNSLNDIVSKFRIPISFVDIYHSDGSWYMVKEMISRESHPLKYGYGKLLHSGYHFIDLLCQIYAINQGILHKDKTLVDISSKITNPLDFTHFFNSDTLTKLLRPGYPRRGHVNTKQKLKKCGEIDYFGQFQFLVNEKVVTTAMVSLLLNGFSRRSWSNLPTDTYKANGRVRHERLHINIGPLFCVQLHSYQAYEVVESDLHSNGHPGDIDHLDLYVFRNSKIIGGKTFEHLTEKDFFKEKTNLGHNEEARLYCLKQFLTDKKIESDISSHINTCCLLSLIYESIAARSVLSSRHYGL